MILVLFFCAVTLCYAQVSQTQWQALMSIFDALDCTSCPRFSVHDPCPAPTAIPGYGMDLVCQGTNVRGITTISGHNSFLPTEIGQLTGLQAFSCVGPVSGPLPTELGLLSALTAFSISDTKFDSTLPTELGMWTNLQSLYIGNTEITSTLPCELGKLSALSVLQIFNTPIVGTIPSGVVSSPRLRWFILENTKNTGTVPLALFNSSANLDSIHVVSDLMCGSLPSNIGLATSLRTLYDPQRANNTSFHSSCKTRMVGGHSFQGELPPELWQLTHLTSLVLNQGNFRILPTQIGRLTELVTLQIFACDVTGSIPSQLGYLSKLRTLFVRFNGFGGSLPREVLTLPSLSGLFVHNNRLTGTIGAISPSISSCFVQGYSDFADSNCMQCSAPCCDSVVASCAPRFDDCFAPKVLRGDGTTAFSTVNATALACMGCSAACVIRRDIWFEWSATCAGTATISVCDRDNVALVVYENGICPSPYAANGNDSDCTVWPVCASGRGAVTQATVVAGQKLLIRVGSLVANAGFDGSIQVDCAGAPAAIQCLHEQTSTTSTSTSITSTSTTTPATTTATTTTTTTTTIVDSTTAPMSTTTTDGMSSIAAPSSNSTTADNLATVNTDTSIAVVSRLSTTSRASSSSSAGSTSSSSSAGSPGSSVEDDNVRQSHADDGGALSPTVLNGIIGGVVALVAVLCIALIATAVLMRRAARANKRASPLAMSLRERRQSSQSQAQAFGSDYDRFPFPTEVADAAAHYEELAPQEVN